jgi:hypothetical protein
MVHQHLESRVGIDLDARLKGLNLYLNKWGDDIHECGGYQAVDFIRRKYSSIAYSHAP